MSPVAMQDNTAVICQFSNFVVRTVMDCLPFLSRVLDGTSYVEVGRGFIHICNQLVWKVSILPHIPDIFHETEQSCLQDHMVESVP